MKSTTKPLPGVSVRVCHLMPAISSHPISRPVISCHLSPPCHPFPAIPSHAPRPVRADSPPRIKHLPPYLSPHETNKPTPPCHLMPSVITCPPSLPSHPTPHAPRLRAGSPPRRPCTSSTRRGRGRSCWFSTWTTPCWISRRARRPSSGQCWAGVGLRCCVQCPPAVSHCPPLPCLGPGLDCVVLCSVPPPLPRAGVGVVFSAPHPLPCLGLRWAGSGLAGLGMSPPPPTQKNTHFPPSSHPIPPPNRIIPPKQPPGCPSPKSSAA